MTFEEMRRQYESDEQLARELYLQVEILQSGIVLEQSLRRRAEARLDEHLNPRRKYSKQSA